ncbi:DUF1385 domain-containing protein [Chengkuizengella axinellae]|uniref:DUF1385 domain-containing protein n=1 Tax=Chengkuizengella axinellae TaxID=3064388 RepID=A0ABT9J3X9_9BACL|nr:DUF1385 domain-containing protein [Chengkuizengella sp. 2205SS18-9]MDP5275684.1 DUF1385 domain-containing protein [Chengkuizengella sp. 2205SS18-9]
MSQENRGIYGGQAVIEGVMFAGKTVNVTAVRRQSNNEIDFFSVPKRDKKWVQTLKKIPLLRGMVGIVEASAKGASHLNFSAEVFAEEEGEEVKKEEKKGLSNSLTMILGVAVVGVLSFLFGKFVFTLLPVFIEAGLFGRFAPDNQVLHTFIEGIIKMMLLVGYIYVISFTPIIRRLFQYHGAEHKVISAYENNEELTVENVQKYSTLHYRCGSSFMVFTVILGVIIYSIFALLVPYDSYWPYNDLWGRIIQRLVLLPVVIGVSYEVLRFTNSLREIPVLRYLGYPGLMLQKLTTKQPTDDQVEVSIASFKHMLELDQKNGNSENRMIV